MILLGVRAYTARPELATNNQRLLDYVQNGGVLIVQYNPCNTITTSAPIPTACPTTPNAWWTKPRR